MHTRSDPTRTTMLRRQFAAEMRRRFAAISRAIREIVIDLDVFGLEPGQPFIFNVERQEWRFQTDEQKTRSFRRWLQSQVDQNLLTTDATGRPWTGTFVESAYRRGTVRAFTDARREALAEDQPGFIEGSRAEFLRSAFTQPERLSKIRLLATRSFEELRGVTAAMSQQLNRVLSDGLSRGLGPREIARTLTSTVTRITRTRALVLARTEIIHAHAEGQLDAFEDLGIEEIGVLAEWSTAGDDRVCPQCQAMEGQTMRIREARGLIPRHPNCRCAFIPSAEATTRGRRRRLMQAVGRSLRSERRRPRTTRVAAAASTWIGKELR